MHKIRQLIQKPGYRYLLVGGSVYVFEVAVIIIAGLLGMGPVLSVALSFILGTLVSFALQKIVTFGDKRMHHRILLPQLIATCLLVAFNFLFTLFITDLLTHLWPVIFSRTLALAITTVWNFYLYKTHIFKQGTPAGSAADE